MGNQRGMRRDFEALEKRRMAAVRLFPTDLNNSEIGRRLKICDQTVSRWRAQYRSGGESALRKAGRAGRKPLLSTADQKRLGTFGARSAKTPLTSPDSRKISTKARLSGVEGCWEKADNLLLRRPRAR